MAEQTLETITSRFMRLNKLMLGKQTQGIPNYHLLHRDGLLDALVAFYEECNNDYMRKDKHVAAFVDKIRNVMSELKWMRVNVRDFEVKKIIGRGHFGDVQVVREKATGDVYAMKVLRKAETLSQRTVAFYEEERDIMAKAISPWITKLQYAFQDNQHLYFIMEFHPGGDMLALLERYDNILPDEMACFYLAELTLAIHSLHSMGYAHRDIKPDNVLIDRTGHIKLADFGSASKLNAQKTVISRMPVGTPDYIAPEVLIAMNNGPASSKSYGVECDWWSLGIVAYEMLFGSTPFSDEKVLITYNNIMNYKKSLKFPEEASEIPEPFIDVIKGLLQESVQRLGYEQLINHKLFTDIDWNNIRQTAPPFVPTVNSQDDTSNFDEFEQETRPSVRELSAKKEFSGKNLPFVGFTYTSPFESLIDRISASLDNSISSPLRTVSSDNELLSKRKEVVELQKKVALLKASEDVLKSRVEKLEESLEAKQADILSVEKEQSSLQEYAAEMESENKNLRRLLSFERKDRVMTEKKALEMLKCLKGYKKKECYLQRNISDEQKKEEQENNTVTVQLQDALSKLEVKEKTIENLISELKEKKVYYKEKLAKDLKKNVANETLLVQAKLTDLEQQLSLFQEKYRKIETENSNLEIQVSEFHQKNNELKEELVKTVKVKAETQEQMEALKFVIFKLESELCKVEKDSLRAGGESGDTQVTNAVAKLERELEEKHSVIAELQKQLMNEQEKCSNIESQLQDTEQDLNLSKTAKDTLEKHVRSMEGNESNLNTLVTNLHNTVSSLETKLRHSEGNVKALQKEKTIANEIVDKQAKRAIKEAASDLTQENQYLSTKLGQVEAENIQLKEDIKSNKFRNSEWEDQLKKKESELSEVKLDLRIATREKKQAEDMVSTLRSSNRDLREKLGNFEKTVMQKAKIEEDLRKNISQLKKDLVEKTNEVEKKSKMYEIESAKLEERVKAMQETCETSKTLHEKYAKYQGQYEEIAKQNEHLKTQLQEKENEKMQFMENQKSLKNELSSKVNECLRFEKIVNALKTTCTMLEDQVKDYEFLVETHEDTISKKEKELKMLQKEIESLENDLKHINSCICKEKSLRVKLEQQVDEMTEESESQQALHDAEMRTLQEQLSQQRELAIDLGQQVTELEKGMSLQDHNNKTIKRKTTALEEEVVKIKEEAARHITQIASLKSSNLKLTQALEEALENQKLAQETIDQLCSDLESEEVTHKHEMVKLQQTVSQQTKLIDFLQSKAEGMEKKRKVLNVPRLFGKKDNISSSVPLQWRDMETLLEKERIKCRRLQDHLSQCRAENMALRNELNQNGPRTPTVTFPAGIPISPISRAMHSALALSPNMNGDVGSPDFVSQQVAHRFAKPQGERMKHKIPHRFIETMCMRGTKCSACLDSIHFGRYAAKCHECEAVCHVKCASSLPSTCGLPSGFVQHFASSVKGNSELLSAPLHDMKPEGWVNVPRSNKQGWEKRYIRLVESVLYFFEKAEVQDLDKAIDHVDLAGSNGEVVVTSAVSATELVNVAKSDLPYVLKVEFHPRTTCWPPRCLYLMTLNFGDKQMWVSSLESLIKCHNTFKNEIQDHKLMGHSVLKLKEDRCLDINCTFILNEDVLLLGAMEGLFVADLTDSTSNALKSKIEGIDSVYQMASIRSLGLVILITGEYRDLHLLQIDVLHSWAKCATGLPPVQMKSVADMKNCHLFAVQEDCNSDAPYLCAATSDRISLHRWNTSMNAFCKKKAVETQEPCSCISFTENTVIIGVDRFLELDLKTYAFEEFLDCSDTSLACLVYGVSQFRIFPVAIFQVAPSNQPEEYLLCFHELGVFVDGFGQRTRQNDMKWTRLPLAFAYRSPYLFVTHFNSLEVVEILSQENKEKGAYAVMEVSSPRYLGPAVNDGAIYMYSSHDQCIEVLCVQGNLAGCRDSQQQDSNSTSTVSRNSSSASKESGSSDFSFSTSLIQSLDQPSLDNLSLPSETSEQFSAKDN